MQGTVAPRGSLRSCAASTYVAVAHEVMADVVMAYVVMAYVGIFEIVMAYVVMPYVVTAHIVMAHLDRTEAFRQLERAHILSHSADRFAPVP